MSSKIYSAASIGLNAHLVEVEAALGGGDFGQISIVGLPDASVSEAKERVRSAIINSQLNFPKRKITINLAPANLRKMGPIYDLPIAISVLALRYKLNLDLEKSLFVGELSLSGQVRPVNNIIALTLLAKKKKLKNIFIPLENALEASLVKNINIFPLKYLSDIFSQEKIQAQFKEFALSLKNNAQTKIKKTMGIKRDLILNTSELNYLDFAEIKGQEQAKRALKIAVAGAHNILLVGPPGCGKTTLAQASLGILPDLTENEQLEIAKIISYQDKNFQILNNLDNIKRPFRAPHHESSLASIIGGGRKFSLGEFSLAHLGILFLDELPEFSRNILESLRQALEVGQINLARADFNFYLPAQFIFIAAMNPCPCGLSGLEDQSCLCSLGKIKNYQNKISQAVLDRIDLHLNLSPLKYADLEKKDKSNALISGENSKFIKQKIEAARLIQKNRNLKTARNSLSFNNAYLNLKQIKKFCVLESSGQKLMEAATKKLKLSARAYYKILKIARTIADLENQENIQNHHLAEALQYRSFKF